MVSCPKLFIWVLYEFPISIDYADQKIWRFFFLSLIYIIILLYECMSSNFPKRLELVKVSCVHFNGLIDGLKIQLDLVGSVAVDMLEIKFGSCYSGQDKVNRVLLYFSGKYSIHM